MESRFKIRFWPSRRVKRNPAELDLHSVPYQTAPSDPKQPVFIHQSLGRNLSERQKRESTAPLRALSYRQVKSGKLPEVGGRPHKGNGPVKLQTSRRLSSGELLTTSQDSQRTLDEIREGEYIVGAKDRRDSRVRSPSLSRQQMPTSTSQSLGPPQNSPWTTVPGSTPLLDIPEHGVDPSSTPMSIQSAPNRIYNPSAFGPNVVAVDGLGLSGTLLESPSGPQSILKSSASLPISLLEPYEEQNATIQALWKAEYGRLVSMYGQAGVDRNIAELRRDQTTTGEEAGSGFSFEPLPQPGLETREVNGISRTGTNPRGDGPQHEDNSDESSYQRLSFISSVGYASSYTTRASFAETDSINTRDDIRKMVDDMRSTYLRAIEAREPSRDAVTSLKKRKKKRKSSPSSAAGTPQASRAISPSTPTLMPSTPDPQERRSVSGPSPILQQQRSTRNFSSPVAGINKLPAIEASPSRDREPEVGLRRADSSTLGALMGEYKRSSIQKRKSKRQSRRISSQQQISQKNSPSRQFPLAENENTKDPDMVVLDEDFHDLYKDIFRTSTNDFWSTQPSFNPTITMPSTIPSPTRPPPPLPI